MRELDLARFQTLLVGHEFFRGKNEPYWLHVGGEEVFGRVIGYKKIFSLRDAFTFLRFGLNMLEKCAGSFECLDNRH